MAELKELLQSADWKKEKHVPVIDAPDSVKKSEFFKVTLTVGKEIAHPNTTAHHIRWYRQKLGTNSKQAALSRQLKEY